MNLTKIFRTADDSSARKRKALKKVLRKLKKTRDAIKAQIKAGPSDKKLKTRLKANTRHRDKARSFLAELE